MKSMDYSLTIESEDEEGNSTSRDVELTVEYSIQGADPSVGIFNSYVEEWYVTEVDGDKDKDKIQEVGNYIESNSKVKQHLEDKLNEIANEPEDYSDYYE